MERENNDFFQVTVDLLKEYVDDRILLLKIQAAEKTGKMASFMVSLFVIALLLFFVFLFASLMLAMYFSQVFDSQMKGFGLIALIYLVVLCVYLIFKKYFKSNFVINTVIKLMFTPSKVEQDIDEDYYD